MAIKLGRGHHPFYIREIREARCNKPATGHCKAKDKDRYELLHRWCFDRLATPSFLFPALNGGRMGRACLAAWAAWNGISKNSPPANNLRKLFAALFSTLNCDYKSQVLILRNSISLLAVLLSILSSSKALNAAEQKPARWEKDIAAFEASDRKNPPAKGGVLFIGSSSIRYWKTLATDFPKLEVINRGFGGSYVADSTHFAERIIFPYEPSKIVLYAGDNDIAGGHSPEQVFSDFREFVEKVHSKLPETKIYYLAVKPSPSRWHLSPQGLEANNKIKRYARFRPKVEFIDVWSPLMKDGRPDPALFEKDRLHINSKGYELWRDAVRKALKD